MTEASRKCRLHGGKLCVAPGFFPGSFKENVLPKLGGEIDDAGEWCGSGGELLDALDRWG